ncbi:MAG: YqgE/AlgH family protein [Mycobacteriales bacterium]
MTWEGKLLVATPVLTEGTFARSVVQLLQHTNDDGALGVVLNRPSETALSEVLPGWALLAPDPVVVFEGGPVQQTAAICLGRLATGAGEDPSYVAVPGAPWLGTVDLDLEAADPLEEVRVFAGYAGWSPGQLEAEVEEGGWWVLDALPGDCFTSSPELLWGQVLRRQGLPLALAASYPPDPTLN